MSNPASIKPVHKISRKKVLEAVVAHGWEVQTHHPEWCFADVILMLITNRRFLNGDDRGIIKMNTRKRYIEAFSLLERDDIDQHSRMAEFLEIVDSVGRAIRDSEYRTIFKMGDLSIEDFYEWGNSSIVHNAAKKVQRRIGKFIKQQHEILRKVRISESNKKRKEQARV